MRVRFLILVLVTAFVAAACSSGPTDAVIAAARAPQTTTTTEAPPEGIIVVRITNGAFRPSNLDVDLTMEWIVEWRHEDSDDREYVIEARNGEFESPPLSTGDVFQVDFSGLEPDIYRYFAFIGNTRIPGTVDTRPEQ
ncbi:MAG TPA: hypothetical protein VLG28_05235 [Acidimicrobiia bacterium]|nr:hypothetical protein [Acidimicrobiia bacterium]